MHLAERTLDTARTMLVGMPFRVAAAMRGGVRVFHPRGLVATGHIELDTAWWTLPTGTRIGVVARLSGGVGTPSRVPDVLGLALWTNHPSVATPHCGPPPWPVACTARCGSSTSLGRPIAQSPAAPASATGTAIPGFSTRALTPDDRDAVVQLHEQLSAEDTHLRFFAPRPKHLGEFAAQLCRQDYAHLSLGAFEGHDLVGVANYVVTDTTPGQISAEIALVVAGHEQRHGIGTRLVRELGTAAYLHGVAHLTAEILAENTLMLAIITEQGWTDALHRHGAAVHFDLEPISHRELHPQIPEMPQDGNPGRAIRKGAL